MTVASHGVKAKDTKVTSCEMSGAHHGVGVGLKRDQRKKLGKMIAAIVAGTNTTKGEFHGSNVLFKGSGLDDRRTSVAGDFASAANLTRILITLSNNDGSATGQTDVGHQEEKPFDEFGFHSSV